MDMGLASNSGRSSNFAMNVSIAQTSGSKMMYLLFLRNAGVAHMMAVCCGKQQPCSSGFLGVILTFALEGVGQVRGVSSSRCTTSAGFICFGCCSCSCCFCILGCPMYWCMLSLDGRALVGAGRLHLMLGTAAVFPDMLASFIACVKRFWMILRCGVGHCAQRSAMSWAIAVMWAMWPLSEGSLGVGGGTF